MAANFAEIWVKLGLKKDDFDKGIKEVEGGTKKLDQSFMDTVKSTAALGVGIAAAGAAVYQAGKQIYELGARGAIVEQTANSFEYLSKKLELPADLLEQLRKASRGTVDDMTLMSSTSTLLAGTTDELGKALGNATPQLLEIAKAANKLNPSLGTTSHMYESIALGIKRASPMILDNLGLTIKIGDANEKMAEQLGKSVESLTAEEKQMALLNATLAAGDNLIAQVGGTVDSATDAYEQNAAALSNLKDALAVTVNEGIYPLVQGFADFYSAVIPAKDAYELMHEAMEKGIITEAEMIELDRQQADGLITLEEIIAMLTGEIEKADLAQGLLNDQMEEAKLRFANAKLGADGYTESLENTEQAQGLLNIALKEYNDKLLFTLASQNLTAEAAFKLAEELGLVDQKTVAAYKSVGILTDKYDKNKDGIINLEEAQDGYIESVGRTGKSIDTLSSQLGNAAGQAARLGRELRGLPTSKNIKITTTFVTVGSKKTPIVSGAVDRRQHGGPVGMGSPYIVGEAGPELFVPNASGSIIPNNRMGSIGSNMMAGISSGIGSGYTDTARNTMRAMGGLVASAEKALGISSPSEMFYDIGVEMMTGLEMGILHRMPYVNDAILKAGNGLYNTFQDTMLNRNPDLLKVWNMMWNTIKNSSDETLSDLGGDYSDFFEIMRDQFRDGYAFISGEWIEIMDYMVTNTDTTKDEMIAILESLGVEATEGWEHYMKEFGVITDDGLSGVIGDAERFSKDFVDVIKITWNDILYVTDKSSAAYIDLWDKTAEGTREAALKILGDMNDVIGFEWPTTDFIPRTADWGAPLPPKPTTADWGAPLPPKPTTADWGAPLPPKYQHGGSFIVPSGFPGDTFPIRVSSGERVTVQRKDQQSAGVNQVNNLNIYTNAPVTSDVPDLLLLRAWSNG